MFDQEITLPHHLPQPGLEHFDLESPSRGEQCPFCGQQASESELIPCLDCGERLCPSCLEDAQWHKCTGANA